MTKQAPFTTLVVFAFVSAICLMASTSGAHFFSASGSVLDDGDLAISFDEADLGNENVNYTLTRMPKPCTGASTAAAITRKPPTERP